MGEVDLFRNGSLEQLPSVVWKLAVHRLAVAAWSTRKHFKDTLAVQFGRVRIANVNQQWWQRQPGLSLSTNQQQEGPAEIPRNVLGCASLRKGQRRRETLKCCTASSISKPSSTSFTIRWVLLIPSKYQCVLHGHLSQLTSLCQSARVCRNGKNCSTAPEVL